MKNNSLYGRHSRPLDTVLQTLIGLSAAVTVAVLVGILLYILINGVPYLSMRFLTTAYSETDDSLKGILPMILNTLYVVVITLLISAPVGLCSAIYLTQYAKQGRLVKVIRFATEVLSGIPSILFGLFGYTVFCILFRLQTSILAGCLTMTLCILPLIIRTTEESLLSVPSSYQEGAMALGAGKLRVIMGIVLPCAMPGVLTA
ncbi:MAG TPA: phosphate ABC transporter permease PtsA, partial [Ruminococcaceae bacterium]|nr:phosphate ABC transporter permease PtsA [Oscillospiraceae bacterium]